MSETKTKQHLPDLTATRVHHVGLTVASLDRALEFWEAFLGVERLWRMMLDRPYLGRHVGYPGVKIDAAFVPLPGGAILELLEYQLDGQGAESRGDSQSRQYAYLPLRDERAIGLGAGGGAGRQARGAGGAGGCRRRAEQGRARRLSPHP